MKKNNFNKLSSLKNRTMYFRLIHKKKQTKIHYNKAIKLV